MRIILRAMRERIEQKIMSLKRWVEKLVVDRVIMEKKFVGGGRHRKLRLTVRRLTEIEYGRKWREELEETGKHLTLQFGKVDVAKDEEIIAGVTWSDKDLGPKPPENYKDNVVVMGNIVPPITDNEYEYLGMGPKQRVNGKITVTEVEVSC